LNQINRLTTIDRDIVLRYILHAPAEGNQLIMASGILVATVPSPDFNVRFDNTEQLVQLLLVGKRSAQITAMDDDNCCQQLLEKTALQFYDKNKTKMTKVKKYIENAMKFITNQWKAHIESVHDSNRHMLRNLYTNRLYCPI
jgi:hypothetical protein